MYIHTLMCIIDTNAKYLGYIYFHLRFDEVENGVNIDKLVPQVQNLWDASIKC